MNKKELIANSYARVRVVPYVIFHDQLGNEVPRNATWMMVANEDRLRIEWDRWSIPLGFDFIDGYTVDACAPCDSLKHGILKLLGTVRIQGVNAKLTPLSRHAVESLILEQDRLLARATAACELR